MSCQVIALFTIVHYCARPAYISRGLGFRDCFGRVCLKSSRLLLTHWMQQSKWSSQIQRRGSIQCRPAAAYLSNVTDFTGWRSIATGALWSSKLWGGSLKTCCVSPYLCVYMCIYIYTHIYPSLSLYYISLSLYIYIYIHKVYIHIHNFDYTYAHNTHTHTNILSTMMMIWS